MFGRCIGADMRTMRRLFLFTRVEIARLYLGQLSHN